jgi:tRNA(Ile)-lysidine synthase TilS/MesJ
VNQQASKDYVLCTRCILPGTFPGISFDEEGVCNYCQKYRGGRVHEAKKKKYEQKFLSLLKEHKKTDTYDVIVAYSGGKDSTYTLDVLVNRYKMRALALTFDNTFISPRAEENIRQVCGALGVDLIMVRPAPKMLRRIFATAARTELYSAKTLERASTICTSCISFVKGIVLRTALEKEIPFIGYGWSPGQAPVQASVMRTNAALMRNNQQTTLQALLEIAGDDILPFFVTDKQFEQTEKFPWNIHPLAFLPYDEEKIVQRIKEFGWEKPDDTDPNSSNCLLNAYANQIHRNRYHFHPYVWEIANMVREGVMSREEGLEKIEPPEVERMVMYSKNILDQVPSC